MNPIFFFNYTNNKMSSVLEPADYNSYLSIFAYTKLHNSDYNIKEIHKVLLWTASECDNIPTSPFWSLDTSSCVD